MVREKFSERLITRIIQIAGYLSILYIGLISVFLLKEGIPALFHVSLSDLFGTRWYPIESYYGILPLMMGSITITIGALDHCSSIGCSNGYLYFRNSASLDA